MDYHIDINGSHRITGVRLFHLKKSSLTQLFPIHRLLRHALIAGSAILFAAVGLSAKKASQPDKGANKYQHQQNFLDHDSILSSNAPKSLSASPAARHSLQ